MTATARTRREVDALAAERERALTRYQGLVEATSAAVWIREPDGSAVQDAPALRAITGQDVEGYRGWGFLDAVDPAHRDEVRSGLAARAIADGAEVVTCTYRLCTARGYRWFRTRAVPVRVAGVVVEWVGTETDVDDEVRARQRLDVLARATRAVGAVHEPEAELTALAESVVPEFADVCRVYLVDPLPTSGGAVTGRRSVTRHGRGRRPVAVERRAVLVRTRPSRRALRAHPRLGARARPGASRAGVLRAARAAPVDRGDRRSRRCSSRPSCRGASWWRRCCSSRAGGVRRSPRTTGRSSSSWRRGPRPRSSTPSTSSRPARCRWPCRRRCSAPRRRTRGVEVQARYLPAAADLEVGGDWYDAFDLPDGDLAVGVGDVAGHDLSAAATMGQLRSMLRALAYETEGRALGRRAPPGPGRVPARRHRLHHAPVRAPVPARGPRRCSAGPTPGIRRRCWCRPDGEPVLLTRRRGRGAGSGAGSAAGGPGGGVAAGCDPVALHRRAVRAAQRPGRPRAGRAARPRPPRQGAAVVRPVRAPRPRNGRRHRRRHGRPRAAGAPVRELRRPRRTGARPR